MEKINLDYIVLMHCKKNIDLDKIIQIKSYIPYEEKMKHIDSYCKKVISVTDGIITHNSVDKFVYGILLIISIYTNIDLKMTYDEFDILEKNHLTEEIIAMIDEYSIFKQFLDARFNDYIREYSNKLGFVF